MSKKSTTEAGSKPDDAPEDASTAPRGPYDPKPGVVSMKVLRHETSGSDSSWTACTRYDSDAKSLTPYHDLPDEPISEFILDRWGSGTYYPCWFGPNSKAMGRGKTLELQDPSRPRRPLQFGAPAGIGAPSSSSSATSSAPASDLATLVALLSNPQIATLLAPLLQGQQQPNQLELARLEAQRERDRRDWEERQARERREWDEDRTRMRAQEERRLEREREEAADRRRRADEAHAEEIRNEKRRHALELEQLREERDAGGGIGEDEFEAMFEKVRDELRKEMAEREKGLLAQLFDVVKTIAPAFLPQIQAAMAAAGGARARAPMQAPPLQMPPTPPPATQ